MSSCSEGDEEAAQPEARGEETVSGIPEDAIVGSGDPLFVVESIDEAAQVSAQVIVGKIVAEEPVRASAESARLPDEPVSFNRLLEVEVEETLSSTEADRHEMIVVESAGWVQFPDDTTRPVLGSEGSLYLQMGDRVLLFLAPSVDGAYQAIGPQGEFLLDGDQVVDTERIDEFVRWIEDSSVERLRTELSSVATD